MIVRYEPESEKDVAFILEHGDDFHHDLHTACLKYDKHFGVSFYLGGQSYIQEKE